MSWGDGAYGRTSVVNRSHLWRIVGDEYPEAEVIGIDLSPIQPSWVPPNVKFMVDDAEAEWLFGADTFDLVHARFMCMAIKDWPRLLSRAHM